MVDHRNEKARQLNINDVDEGDEGDINESAPDALKKQEEKIIEKMPNDL